MKTTIFRTLRRSCGILLIAVVAWLMWWTADTNSMTAVLQKLSTNPWVLVSALEAELGSSASESSADTPSLSFWQRLAVAQSPTLHHYKATPLAALPPDPTPAATPSPTPLIEPDDPEDTVIPEQVVEQNIVARTLVPTQSTNYLHYNNVYLYNYTSKNPDIAAMATAPLDIALPSDGPQILIMHTHGSEAFAMDGDDVYVETDAARTTDSQYNIMRVGEEIAQVFTEMGLSVVHDTTLYDYPEYNGSYERSKQGVQDYLEQYPSIQVVLDVHRDAIIADDGTIYKVVKEVDGDNVAQLLLVVGTDDGGQRHPNWAKNLTLGVQIQQSLNGLWPNLARPIALRTTRFNQELTQGSLLVEVGSHGNTLEEALAAARLFARGAGQILLSLLE